MRKFDTDVYAYFESLFRERVQPFRDRHDAQVNKINTAHPARRLNLHLSELKQFRKEYIKVRVDAYIETCRKIATYPSQFEYQEFAKELVALATGGTHEISRVYRDPLGPVNVQTEERVLEVLELELGQLVSPALNPLRLYMAEGKLATPAENADLMRAEQLYESARNLSLETPFSDQDKAKLMIELADDAIKEFGNTNQDKKVELRRIKALAEEILPPKTIEELRKRAEGKALEAFPKNRIIRKALYTLIFLAVVLSALFALPSQLTRPNRTGSTLATPNSSSTPTTELTQPLRSEGDTAQPTPPLTQANPDISNGGNNSWIYKRIRITLINGVISGNRVMIRLKVESASDSYVGIFSPYSSSGDGSHALVDDNGYAENPGPLLIVMGDNFGWDRALFSVKAGIPEYVKVLFCSYRGSTHIREFRVLISDSRSLSSVRSVLLFSDFALTFVPDSAISYRCLR